MKKAPSLRDVAKQAGVSLGTASRALNNKNNVLPHTRSRVLKAASELGYKLQFRVPSAISTKLNTIGVVIKHDSHQSAFLDLFSYDVLSGIEDECQSLGMNVMFSKIPVDDASHAQKISPLFQEKSIDGLIIVGAVLADEFICDALPKNFPIVFVDGCAEFGEYDKVLIDNFEGAYRIVSYLIEQGHQKIALLGSSSQHKQHPSILERQRGYLAALTDHNIEQSYIIDSTLELHVCSENLTQFLKQEPDTTAIFACIDLVAVEMIPVIQGLGYSVPDQLSIVGFDDVDISSTCVPALTTINVDRGLMGKLAVRRLYNRSANLETVPITTRVGTRIINRQSVTSPTNPIIADG